MGILPPVEQQASHCAARGPDSICYYESGLLLDAGDGKNVCEDGVLAASVPAGLDRVKGCATPGEGRCGSHPYESFTTCLTSKSRPDANADPGRGILGNLILPKKWEVDLTFENKSK